MLQILQIKRKQNTFNSFHFLFVIFLLMFLIIAALRCGVYQREEFIKGRRLCHFLTLFMRRLLEGGVKQRKYDIQVLLRNYAENCPFPQNFHTRKLGEIRTFNAVVDTYRLVCMTQLHSQISLYLIVAHNINRQSLNDLNTIGERVHIKDYTRVNCESLLDELFKCPRSI